MCDFTNIDINQLKNNLLSKGPDISEATLQVFKRMEAIAMEADDYDTLAYCGYYIASYHYEKFDNNSALIAIKRALTYGNNVTSCKVMPRSYNLLGLIQSDSLDHTGAARSYISASKYATQIEDHRYICAANNNLASLLSELDDYESALPHYKNAMEAVSHIEDKDSLFNYTYIFTLNILQCELSMDIYDHFSEHLIRLKESSKHIQSPLLDSVRPLLIDIISYISHREYDMELDMEESLNKFKAYIASPEFHKMHDLDTVLHTLILAFELLLKCNNYSNSEKICHIADKFMSDGVPLKFERKLLICRIALSEHTNDQKTLQELYKNFYRVYLNYQNSNNRLLLTTLNNEIQLLELEASNMEYIEKNMHLQELARIDDLTKISNRRSFNSRLQNLYDTMESDDTLALIIFDLDYFKTLNDTYGHPAGDIILKAFANCLSITNPEFEPFRYGGDEFIVTCKNITDSDIEEYISNVSRCFTSSTLSEDISTYNIEANQLCFSAGYYNTSISNSTVHTLLSHADRALYEAKNKGRNCWVNYNDTV